MCKLHGVMLRFFLNVNWQNTMSHLISNVDQLSKGIYQEFDIANSQIRTGNTL